MHATISITIPASPPDATAIDRAFTHTRAYIYGLQARLRKKGIRVHEHVLLGPVVGTIIELAIRGEDGLHALAAELKTGRLHRDS